MGRKSQFPPSVQPGIPRIPKVPSGWKLVPFKDVVRVVKRPVDLEDEQEYQLVTAKRSRGGIVPRERLLGKDILTKTQFYTNSGDFLISRRQIVHGACGIVPTELDNSVVSNEYLVLHTEPKLLKEYLAYFSHTIYFQQTCFHSSIGVDVEKMVFKLEAWLKYKMPLPPIHEQKRIVEILATWDEAIALTERAIEARRRRKNFLIQKFFDPSFFDEEYEILPLEKIAIVERGKFTARPRNDPRYFGGSIPFVQTGDVVASNGFITTYSQTLNEAGLEVSKLFPKGSILVTIAANIGDVAIAEIDVACPDSIVVVQAKTGVCREWLKYALSAKKDDLDALATQNAQKNINLQVLRPLLIHVPSKDKQEKIARILLDCDKEITQTIRLLELYRKQKQGLMQKLLIGEWRVAVQEAA